MYVDIWGKWECGDVEKRMKHVSIMENVGCSSNLNAIKGEGRYKNNDLEPINQQQLIVSSSLAILVEFYFQVYFISPVLFP